MKKFAFAFTVCLVVAVIALPAHATPVACSSISDYSGLEAAGTCTIGTGASQLTFSDFTFTPFASGTGVTPTDMAVSVLDGVPATAPSTDTLFGFEFDPALS